MSSRAVARGERLHRTRQQIQPAVVSAVGLALSLALLVAALGGIFTVQRVDVIGANGSQQAVVQAAGVEGQNIFTVQSDTVVRRVASVGAVSVSQVQTSFPNRVLIYVKPRVAVAALRIGPSLYEVDALGIVIRQASSTSLPVIESPAAPASGGGVLTGHEAPALTPGILTAVEYAVTNVNRAPGGGLAGFRLGGPTGLVGIGRVGWTAIIGSGPAQTLVDRIATLVSVLQAAGPRAVQLHFVDLRNKSPYTRFSP